MAISEFDRFNYLLQQYISGSATAAELNEFSDMLRQHGQDEDLILALENSLEHTVPATDPDELHIDHLLRQIAGPAKQPGEVLTATARKVYFLRTGWFRYAAAILLVIAAGAFFYYYNDLQKDKALASNIHETGLTENILPGGNKAMLTLADGSTIILDSIANGQLANQDGVKIIKRADGQLEYETLDNIKGVNATVAYNTMRTPRGGQYQLSLPDGTKVWLNAASAITYPTVFQGNERSIKVEGEAYLEVARDPSKPFRVSVNNALIEVLGTHFNINAYADEPVLSTTLLEGAVNIIAEGRTLKLAPGQQCQLAATGNMTLVKDANTDQAVAWKNGGFSFYHTKLETMMRQLARWYDIEIVYPKGIPDIKFGGDIQRSLPLPDMLASLTDMQVKFRIEEGRKLIVLP